VTVAERLARIHQRIEAAGGDPSAITLVAATKGQPVATAQEVVAAGVVDLGETKAQELLAKAELLEGVRWHFIGRVQRNKVRQVAGLVHLWQSVDRLSLAAEIARHDPGGAVLVQVNVSGAEQQGGCAPERVAAVVEGCTDLGLDVRGLMAIGPMAPDAEVRAAFARVRALADGLGLHECSMGMSGDLEAAVAAGTTMLRIGTDLVGPREPGRRSTGGEPDRGKVRSAQEEMDGFDVA
jgi:pyridoxal phosphate enzyme (YggS family)